MFTIKKILPIVLVIASSLKVFSQCCSPGNPAGGIGAQSVLEKNTAKISLIYKGGYSDTYFGAVHGSSKPISLNDGTGFFPSVKNANYNFAGISFRFGVTDIVTVESDLGYFINKTQNYAEGLIPTQQKGYGLTDFNLNFKVRVFKKNEFEITPTFGLKIPTSNKKQFGNNGIRIPLDLQSTNAAFALRLGLLLYKGFPEKHLRFFLEGKEELSKQTKVDQFNYNYGNIYFISWFTTWSFTTRWTAVVQFRNEFRNKDIQYENPPREIYSTGSNKLFLVPQLNYSFNNDWDISLFADVPLYQYYNGKQLATKFAAGLQVSIKLVFKSKEKKSTVPSLSKNNNQ